ncbi:MAG TPA: SGNH/GDSL hydrolase family protein [Amnibacterium sp.]|nr:SGNH/GDSL hydrolase family protein [Amnibacterium sp.]
MDTEADPRGAGEDDATPTGSGVRRGVALADPPLTDPADIDLSRPSPWRRFAPGGPDGSGRLISVLILAALIVICLVLAALGVVKATESASQAARAAAAYTPPPPSAAAVATPVVTIIGDAASGASSASTAWPALVAKQLKVTVRPSAAAGEGWIAKGQGGATFVTDAAKVPPTSTVVVFFGGASDQKQTALAVVSAEGKALADVHKRAPQAKIVVVGPVSTAAKAPQPLLRVRDAERTAAQAAKVRFVDPIAAKWFSGQAGVVGADGTPTAKGQKLIADALAAVLQPLA